MLKKDDLWTIEERLRSIGAIESDIAVVLMYSEEVLFALELDDVYDSRQAEV